MENLIIMIITLPMIASIISYFIGKYNENLRDYFVILTSLITFILAITIFDNDLSIRINDIFSLGLSFYADGLRSLLVVLTSFVWLIVSMISKEYFKRNHKQNRFYSFFLFTLGATLGVFLSNDLFTTFIMFEMMSFTSFALVIHEENPQAIKAGKSYISVGIICAMLTLVGMFLMYQKTLTLEFSQLHDIISINTSEYYVPALFILVGFAAKAGLFPIHFWLPDAHMSAPAPASAILSALLTKTGIFGILVIMCQMFTYDYNFGFILLILGIITALTGAILAVFSINLKRILACSSLSQIGFIVVGIGMQGILGSHNAIASAGTILHVVNHSLFKVMLFGFAGIVYLNTHELDLNKIKGFGKGKPLLHILYLVAALGIMGIPGFSGYVSKTLIHESIVEYIHILEAEHLSTVLFTVIEYAFLTAGGFTIAYMLKIYFSLFVEDSKISPKKKYVSRFTIYPLLFVAVLIPIFGILPNQIMDQIATYAESFMHSHAPSHAVNYFSFINLKGSIISISIGLVIYLVLVNGVLIKTKDNENVYLDLWPKKLSIENRIYRPLLLNILPNILVFFTRIADYFTDFLVLIIKENFFYASTEKIIPKEDNYFASYDKRSAPKNINVKDSLSKSLLLITLGILIAIVFMFL